jgi:small subunit ribosomal protein S21e
MTGMIDDDKNLVDKYLPRKCDATNKILHAKDKSSVQINVGEVLKPLL